MSHWQYYGNGANYVMYDHPDFPGFHVTVYDRRSPFQGDVHASYNLNNPLRASRPREHHGWVDGDWAPSDDVALEGLYESFLNTGVVDVGRWDHLDDYNFMNAKSAYDNLFSEYYFDEEGSEDGTGVVLAQKTGDKSLKGHKLSIVTIQKIRDKLEETPKGMSAKSKRINAKAVRIITAELNKFKAKAKAAIKQKSNTKKTQQIRGAHQEILDQYDLDFDKQNPYIPMHANPYYGGVGGGNYGEAIARDAAGGAVSLAFGVGLFLLFCLFCFMVNVILAGGCFVFGKYTEKQTSSNNMKYQSVEEEV